MKLSIVLPECFGGELTLSRLGDTPRKTQFQGKKHNRIIYAQITSGAIDFLAADWMAATTLEPQAGNTFSMYVTGDTYDDLEKI